MSVSTDSAQSAQDTDLQGAARYFIICKCVRVDLPMYSYDRTKK